ncbi:Embryonic stem cell-specific 5-hydroxymethylcytosine-binding protein [Vanrija pseudolonga]|uniref:Embryonic stem cell-specific 5-hydroxymethylcytosine-binding protein n=1 Tax=Vanrija pseudolonga TaxID=143232 RepID=A0AAF0Y740_9TREE|nr:Embryonic stem cell-specific 5-hydroxymethylcytosine-binding protein [Vanrija pseudolonga]
MCGRYALGAAHIAFLEGLQAQYGRLFPNRRHPADEDDEGGGPMRLRGGAPDEHEDVKLDFHAADDPEKGFPKWEREQDFWPSYNIAPRQRAPVVRRDQETGEVMIETMQWGLIPHWTKYPPTGPLNTINARSEALIDPSSGGMWHALKQHKRCIIPAQGYYEWQKKGATKVAHFARLPVSKGTTQADPPIMFFAGLWDTVKYVEPVASKFVPKEGDDREPYPTGNPVPLSTFTILTTTPSKDIAWLHDRMPCILTSYEDIARWLDLGEVKEGWKEGKGGTADVLHSVSGLDCYPVVPEVGKIGRSEQSYILPVAERKDGIKSFFAKQQPSPAKPKGAGSGGFTQAFKEDKKPVIKEEAVPAVKEETKPDVTETKPAAADVKAGTEPKAEPVDDDDIVLLDTAPSQSVKSESSKPASSQRSSQDSKPEPATPGKRKRGDERGGHQTKIIRQTPKEEKKGQPSITSFFKSPRK